MSSSDLQALYQELVLDHARHPRGQGLQPDATAESHQVNPTCGDEVTLAAYVSDGVVSQVRWEGHGCAISQASASMLAELARDIPATELLERVDGFRELVRSRGAIEPDEDLYGDAAVLSSVSKYPARVKCAMLAWVAAEDAVRQSL